MADILTLRLDPDSQTRFDHERRLYFPPERNHIPAHLTLFYALPFVRDSALPPGVGHTWITRELEQAAATHSPFPLAVTGLRSLGKGVAYRLSSSILQGLHAGLAAAFTAELILQDRQRLQPHVVIQNKVTPQAARQLLAELQPRFSPWTVTATGFDLWHYLGGPWQHLRTISFSASPVS